MFQLVMSNLQSILENVDTPELLCQSVTCILQVARCYPHIFSINFRVSPILELKFPPYIGQLMDFNYASLSNAFSWVLIRDALFFFFD